MTKRWSRCLKSALSANTLVKFIIFCKFGYYFNVQIIKWVFKVNVPYSYYILRLRTSIYLTNNQLNDDKRENRFWLESHDFVRVNLSAKKQQLFLYSNNGKYMIKMTDPENKLLRRILPHYFRHCISNPKKTTKLLGIYKIKNISVN